LRRVACHARHPSDAIAQVVERLELLVRERPVVADAVQRTDAEVRGVVARKCALQWMVLPPTALYMSGANMDSVLLTG
jgi:hypothetical protein